jgi:hypothetical protein
MDDLDKLKSEYTFAMNKIYLCFEKTQWRPSLYMIQDEKMVTQILGELKNADLELKIIPHYLRDSFESAIGKTLFYNYEQRLYNGITTEFSFDPSKIIYEGGTVAFCCLQLALYMGFNEVYLIGVDLNYSIQITENGLEVQNVKDYFADNYISYTEDRNFPNVYFSRQSYEIAKKAYGSRGAKIFNATRGGKLEIFERVSFDDIIVEKGKKHGYYKND